MICSGMGTIAERYYIRSRSDPQEKKTGLKNNDSYMKLHYLSDLIQTMLAIFPHAEIHAGNRRTRHISLGVGGT